MTQRRSCQACYYDGNNSSYVANIFPANCNKPFDKGVMKRFFASFHGSKCFPTLTRIASSSFPEQFSEHQVALFSIFHFARFYFIS